MGFGARPGIHPPARLHLTTRQANLDDEQVRYHAYHSFNFLIKLNKLILLTLARYLSS